MPSMGAPDANNLTWGLFVYICRALKMLYTLHPIDDELRNFQTMLENCVKVTLHWCVS